MEADRTGLVHLWLHFAGVCYKCRVSVERTLADNKSREGLFAGPVCTGVKHTGSFESQPRRVRQMLKHAVTKSRSKPGPSSTDLSSDRPRVCSPAATQRKFRGRQGFGASSLSPPLAYYETESSCSWKQRFVNCHTHFLHTLAQIACLT